MADVTVANTSPGLVGKTLACHDADGLTTGIWTFTNKLALAGGAPANQTWQVYVDGQGNWFLAALGSFGGLVVDPAGSGAFSSNISEKGRTTPLGHWIDVPFSAANFTADAGTWTIGTVLTNAYTLIGKTLVYMLAVQGCSLSATPTTLIMTLPAGLTTPAFMTGTVFYQNGTAGTGVVFTTAGGSQLKLARDVALTPWNASGPATTLYATITLKLA